MSDYQKNKNLPHLVDYAQHMYQPNAYTSPSSGLASFDAASTTSTAPLMNQKLTGNIYYEPMSYDTLHTDSPLSASMPSLIMSSYSYPDLQPTQQDQPRMLQPAYPQQQQQEQFQPMYPPMHPIMHPNMAQPMAQPMNAPMHPNMAQPMNTPMNANLSYVDAPAPLYVPPHLAQDSRAENNFLPPVPEKGYPPAPMYSNYTFPSEPRSDQDRILDLKNEIKAIDELDKFERQERRRNTCCCCCCPTSRRGRFFCGAFVFLFLLGIGLFAFFYWPRVPQFSVVDLKVNEVAGKDPFQFVQNDPNNKLNFTLTLDLILFISLVNDNRYHIKVAKIDLDTLLTPNLTTLRGSGLGGTGSLTVSTNPESKSRNVGHGEIGNLYFAPFKTTNFTMNVQLSYQPDPKTGLLGDIIFSEMFQACGLAGTPPRRMRVDYNANVNIDLLSRVGYVPKFSNKVTIGCPFSKDRINQILQNLGFPTLKEDGTPQQPQTDQGQ